MVKNITSVIVALAMLFMMAGHASAQAATKKEQTVYVPAYPHVFMGPKGTTFDLTVTLVIRNTDFKIPISVTAVDYYDTDGKLTKRYLPAPVKLNPMGSTHVLITEKDTSGGIGSNFIVRWRAEREVNIPVIEAVMIGGKSGQGISFISEGREIGE
jgi:hypothetical protein